MQKRTRFRLAGAIALIASLTTWVGCGGADHEIVEPDMAGAVEVKTATTGQEIDPDGYAVSLDGGGVRVIAVNDSVTIDGLAAENHDVQLTGVAANCTVAGNNPRTVTVPAGGTALATFDVSCAPTGSLEARTATTGEDVDPNGYSLTVDGGAGQAIGVSETVTISGLAAGSHEIELSDVAANCTVVGNNPRTVNVAAGSTTAITFDVSCAPTTGSLEVTTVTAGLETDPDGYWVLVDGAYVWAVGVSETVTIRGVAAGERQVGLAGLAAPCAVIGGFKRVSVPAGGTAQTTFEVVCQTALVNQIAFSWYYDWDGGINVMNADGSGQTRLSPNGYDPAVSPDGTQILFVSTGDIYVMKANGSGRVNLSQHPAFDSDPRWSPDGTRIAFTSDRDAGGASEIFVMNADGSNPVNITHGPALASQASWSPDGTRIAFTSDRTGDLEIFVMNADGSNPVNLTNDADSDDFAAAWSPDGTRIAFTSDRTGDREIFVMDADGSNPVNLTNRAESDSGPSWSRDGSRITFTSDLTSYSAVFVMNADGSALIQLSNGIGSASAGFPQAWSP